MSHWTYVRGTVEVSPMGRTQAEMRYILETVLDHLPKVTGSEGPMDVYIIQPKGHNMSSSHTEFGMYGGYINWDKDNLSLEVQNDYILVVDGSLRDREFDQTYREFQKWLCRLAKRIHVQQVLVEVRAYSKSVIIQNPHIERDNIWETVYGQMYEDPTWVQDYNKSGTGEPNWCEYLMWERMKGGEYPMMLAYKYYSDPENDKEVERRLKYKCE